MRFLSNVFNQFSEMILREYESLPGFIIGEPNVNSIKYACDDVLITASDERFQGDINN